MCVFRYSLGAEHDGGRYKSQTLNNCDPSANIMTGTAGTVTADRISDRFHFSACSIKYFKDLLSGKTDGWVVVERCVLY